MEANRGEEEFLDPWQVVAAIKTVESDRWYRLPNKRSLRWILSRAAMAKSRFIAGYKTSDFVSFTDLGAVLSQYLRSNHAAEALRKDMLEDRMPRILSQTDLKQWKPSTRVACSSSAGLRVFRARLVRTRLVLRQRIDRM
jgi:hypothetical protein